jgi:hypothetical protein
MLWKSGVENRVPDATSKPESSLHSAGGVVIDVMLSNVSEVPVAEVVEVNGVVNPLFNYITLHYAGQ